jgi:hypothetical protein
VRLGEVALSISELVEPRAQDDVLEALASDQLDGACQDPVTWPAGIAMRWFRRHVPPGIPILAPWENPSFAEGSRVQEMRRASSARGNVDD